jgi:hypothetical protein
LRARFAKIHDDHGYLEPTVQTMLDGQHPPTGTQHRVQVGRGEFAVTPTDRVEGTVDYAEVCQTLALVAPETFRTVARLCTEVADRPLGPGSDRNAVGRLVQSSGLDPDARLTGACQTAAP